MSTYSVQFTIAITSRERSHCKCNVCTYKPTNNKCRLGGEIHDNFAWYVHPTRKIGNMMAITCVSQNFDSWTWQGNLVGTFDWLVDNIRPNCCWLSQVKFASPKSLRICSDFPPSFSEIWVVLGSAALVEIWKTVKGNFENRRKRSRRRRVPLSNFRLARVLCAECETDSHAAGDTRVFFSVYGTYRTVRTKCVLWHTCALCTRVRHVCRVWLCGLYCTYVRTRMTEVDERKPYIRTVCMYIVRYTCTGETGFLCVSASPKSRCANSVDGNNRARIPAARSRKIRYCA